MVCDNSVTQTNCAAIKDQRNEQTYPAAASGRACKGSRVYILAVLYPCYQASSCQGPSNLMCMPVFGQKKCMYSGAKHNLIQ